MVEEQGAEAADKVHLPLQPISQGASEPPAAALTRSAHLASQLEGYVATAAARTKEIEQVSLHVEKTRGEIDTHHASTKGVAANMQQQLESAKLLIAEVVGMHGNSQQTSNQAVEIKAKAAAALESIQSLLTTASESANRVEAAKVSAEQTQGVIATKSEHIEGGRVHADKVRGEIDRLFTQAQQSATNAEAQHQSSKTALENLNAVFTAAQTVKANTDSNAEVVASIRSTVEGHATTTKRLAELSEKTEARIATYEGRLKDMQEASEKQRKVIDELLLGATNAGLASAWDKRSKLFQSPERFWNRCFISSLVGLFGLAIWQAVAYGTMSQIPDWQQLVRMFLFKIPFLVPLVWLAIHASRQAANAKRMEEEYAFKATTSMSFEGYRRQMADVGKDLAPSSPLAQLCKDTLHTIAAPPGRVYEKHRMDPTPGTEAAEIIGPVIDGVSKAISVKLPDLKP